MSEVAEGIITTPEGVDPLEADAYYTLAWKNLEDMKAIFQTTGFDKSQLCQEDKHGAVVKEPHGDGCSKPNGLYLAPGRSWIDFAYREERWQFYKQYLYKVELKDDLKLFPLNNHEQAIEFAKLYGIEEDGAINTIHWNNVAVDFHGISVLNWEKSDDSLLNWYNTFEAPQVVIWKANANKLVFTLVADTKNEAHPKIFKSPQTKGGKRKYNKTRKKRGGSTICNNDNDCIRALEDDLSEIGVTRLTGKCIQGKCQSGELITNNTSLAPPPLTRQENMEGGKRVKGKRRKKKTRKKRTKRSTSRRVHYSRKKRRHSRK